MIIRDIETIKESQTMTIRNQNIGRILRQYRQQNSFTVTDVANQLKTEEKFVSPKTIYGWENGHAFPDADTLLKLCNIYGIHNLLSTFGYNDLPSSSTLSLSEKEQQLICRYRSMPELQPAIDKLLDLNEEGKNSTDSSEEKDEAP